MAGVCVMERQVEEGCQVKEGYLGKSNWREKGFCYWHKNVSIRNGVRTHVEYGPSLQLSLVQPTVLSAMGTIHPTFYSDFGPEYELGCRPTASNIILVILNNRSRA